MSFFCFHQNNSFGVHEGPAINVIIEAAGPDEANQKATSEGLYFDGCAIGRDCPCCGDRWYEVDSMDAEDAPAIYGTPPEDYVKTKWATWGKVAGIPDVLVIKEDGSREEYRAA